MSEIKVFGNERFGEMRVVMRDDQPWFVAADACKGLEIANSRDALSRLGDDEKGVASIATRGGNQDMSIVSFPGLLSLILGSRKPNARDYKRWVTHEVLPAIHKTGSYNPKIDDKASTQRLRAEAMLKNACARQAALWMKISAMLDEPKHKQVCASYASEVLTGQKVIALPNTEQTYSAEEVGKRYGISANMVGRIANANNLKTPEYGQLVLDKSRYSNKEVESFRYNENGLRKIGNRLAQ